MKIITKIFHNMKDEIFSYFYEENTKDFRIFYELRITNYEL